MLDVLQVIVWCPGQYIPLSLQHNINIVIMPKRKIEQVEQDESEEFYGNTEGSESTDDSSNQSSNSGENYV